MIVGVHQPSFFSYAGVIDKIRRSDRFVILANAQFSPGNYHNRFGLDGKWHTLSVHKSLRPLIEMCYLAPDADWERIKRRLPAYADILAGFDDCIGEGLVGTNVAILRRLCAILGIRTEIVMDYATDLRATERLVDLCRHYGATTYLSGASGPKYMDIQQFKAAGIAVEVQDSATTPKQAAIQLLREQAWTTAA